MKPRELIHYPNIGIALVPLTQGQYAIIDLDDVPKIEGKNWCAHWSLNSRTFYPLTSIREDNGKRTTLYIHRHILGTDALEVDHINHNGLDNRRANLTPCSSSHNHLRRRPQGGSSKYKGVSWDKSNSKWIAYIKINQHNYHIGLFKEEINAAKAYDEVLYDWDSGALGNFPIGNYKK